MTELETVAFDIETTGFATDDTLTVLGFDAPIGSRVFLNTGGRQCSPGLEQRIDTAVAAPVSLSTHGTERELLDAVATFADSSIAERDVKLVAYNGERWNGGFDLPFLRTRLSRQGLAWPFSAVPYVDAMEVFETRFNTTRDTLEGTYEELIGAGLGELDPFDGSGEAVDAWVSGDFEHLLLHNIADIRRTRALMDLAERYCSKSDFSMKSLDPIAER